MPDRRIRAALLLALALLFPSVVYAQSPAVTLGVGPAEDGWPLHVQIGAVLDDAGLRGALDSALPLRFYLRAELWRKSLLDRLVSAHEISVAILRDPLTQGYSVGNGTAEYRVESLHEAQFHLAEFLKPNLRPRQSGRHYYIVTLEVETLSLSDLDELRRWLRGDLAPAIGGQSSPGRAVERGLRRLFVRVIGLPTRRFEARTGTFVVVR